MLTRFFHRWEHQLASVSTDRVVRPFDWGLDWIPVNGHGDAAPKARVHAWVDELMRDTSEFFDDPPTRAYQFNPAGPQAAAKGETGTLRFPSALVTPHPKNNTVVARWFPAPGEPDVDSAGPRWWSCRSGIPTRKDTSGCRGFSPASESLRFASRFPITMRACRPS